MIRSLLLCTYVWACQGWVAPLMPASPYTAPVSSTRLYEQPASDSTPPPAEEKQKEQDWLEEWALEGAAKIAKMDLHERTQRAMLAEMVEDRIYDNTVALEKLVDEETGEITDVEEAKEIARQTRSLQSQYKALVTGADSPMLKAISSLKERENRNE